VKISDDTQLTTLLNWFEQYAQDPGGLIRLTTDANTPSAFTKPTGAGVGAIKGNTRSERSNTQIGFNLAKSIDKDNNLNAVLYSGHRDNTGYLSTSSSGAAGSASIIGRDYYGLDLRWSNKGKLMSKPYALVIGLNYGYMKDARTSKSASGGEITSQVPTRDEIQTATNLDEYAQGIWSVDDKLDLHAGLRHTKLDLGLKNNLSTTVGNGDLPFSKTLPVVGVTYRSTPTLNFYANAGQGFETPTLIEVTYTDKSTGGNSNTNLKSSTSNNFEFGTKWIASDSTTANAAIFQVETNNEIIVDSADTYTVYKNYAGKTKRTGFELSVNSDLGSGFGSSLAYTYLDATFATSSGSIVAGKRIPGTYKQQAFAELTWNYPAWGFQTGLNAVYSSDVQVNDANSDSAPSYTVFNLRTSLNQKVGLWSVTEYVTLNNLSDVKYIGSVKVNDSRSRFFEPAAPFNWILGVKAAYKF
jgi:iron complex outermembrane receptor protein